MTYTDNPNEIVFLNDKNIVQGLTASLPDYNGIPSQKLFKETYDGLSTYDKNLSDELARYEAAANMSVDNLCAELSTHENSAAKQFNDLSNWIQNRVEVSVDLISGALSVQQVSSIMLSNRVDSMSATVNSDYVHITGDVIRGDVGITGSATIGNKLSVSGQATFDANVNISGNLVQGKDTFVKNVDRGIALGISSIAKNSDAFVWNGDRNVADFYTSQGEIDGTFNVNPEAGTKGFFVGTRNLSDIIHDDTQLSVNGLTSQINGVSTDLSTWVDARRQADKEVLSANLSGYSNSLCAEISAQVERNRTADKEELSASLSGYSNQLCSSISSTVMNAGYALYNDYEFKYDPDTHYLSIFLKDQNGLSVGKAVDATDFIRNRIVDHIIVVKAGETEDPPTEDVLRIYWKDATGKDAYTDVPLRSFATIYKAGYGITISPDLSISVNADIAKYAEVSYISSYITNTVEPRITTDEGKLDSVSGHVDTIQTYVDNLSSFGPERGIIPTISDSIDFLSTYLSDTVENRFNADEGKIDSVSGHVDTIQTYIDSLSTPYTGTIDVLSIDLHALSNGISGDVRDLSTITVAGIRTDVDTVSVHAQSLQTYANQLSGFGPYVGDIPFISSNIDTLRREIRGAANFCGTIRMNKYEPDWVRKAEGDANISSLFKYEVCHGTEDAIKNGNIYEVEFAEQPDVAPIGTFVMSNPLFAADQYYDTTDGIRLAHKCFLVVTKPDGTVEIPLDQLGPETVRVLAGEWYKPYQLSVIQNKYNAWREGGNKTDTEFPVSVITQDQKPFIVKETGHAISGDNDIGGNNHFLIGNNVFDGNNKIEGLSSHMISADHLSAYDVDSEDISAVNVVIQNKLSVATEVDLLSSNVTVKEAEFKSNYKVTVNNNAEITGTLSVDNKLTATADLVEIAPATHVKNTLSVDNNTTVNGQTQLNDTLTVANDKATTLGGTVEVKKGATFDSNAEVKGNLSVDNKLTADSELSIALKTNISNALSVGGSTELSGNVTVGGTTTFDDNVTVKDGKSTTLGGTLNVKQSAQFGSTVQITSNLSVDNKLVVDSKLSTSLPTEINNTLSVGQAATFAGTLTVNGSSTFNNPVTVATNQKTTLGGELDAKQNASVGGTLGVTGATTLGNTLDVTGATTLGNTLDVTGAASLKSTLGVTGAATFASTVSAGNNLTVYNTLTATTASQRVDVVKLSAGALTADFSAISDGRADAKYNNLCAFQESVELSVSGLNSNIEGVQSTVNTLSTYNQTKAQLSSDGYAINTETTNKISSFAQLKTDINNIITTATGNLTSIDNLSTTLLQALGQIKNALSNF